MAQMKAVRVARANGPLEMVTVDIPKPGSRQALVKIQACGVCHSDFFTVAGAYPGIQFPRVPGHEVVGTIQALGSDVPEWKVGARVGVGWHGGHCGHCHSCRRGDFITLGVVFQQLFHSTQAVYNRFGQIICPAK